jgi:thiamine biosynthesis protein ThiS
MQITVNGRPHETSGTTIADLLIQLGLDSARVVVERNLEIVPGNRQGTVTLCSGDRIEIVHFVGGG